MLGTYSLERKTFSGNKHPSADLDLRACIEQKRKYLLYKRLLDIFVSSLVVLFILTWLIPILYVLIKIDSRGPVFFIQKRVGFLGKSFSCLKFRTMHVNREANVLQAAENDPRITRLGLFLRRSNLDELPQFLNVLAGHMSIVGPRPHMHADCHNFSKVVNGYKLRNFVLPGITGIAQIKGFRGPAENFERIFRRYEWDAFYVKNASFRMDLHIVFETAIQTFNHILNNLRPEQEIHSSTNVPAEWARM